MIPKLSASTATTAAFGGAVGGGLGALWLLAGPVGVVAIPAGILVGVLLGAILGANKSST